MISSVSKYLIKFILVFVMLLACIQTMEAQFCSADAAGMNFASSGNTLSKPILSDCSGGVFSIGLHPVWLTNVRIFQDYFLQAAPLSTTGIGESNFVSISATALPNTGSVRSGYLTILYNGNTVGFVSVSQDAGGSTVPMPPAPKVTELCGSTILTRSTPPSGTTYYWQSSVSGTSTSNSSQSITRTTGSVYYLRARNSSGQWSNTRMVFYDIIPAAPNAPPDLQGDLELCNGGQSGFLGISSSEIGVDYRIHKNGVPGEIMRASYANEYLSWQIFGHGEYYLTAAYSGSTCITTGNKVIVTEKQPIQLIILGDYTNVCGGDNLSLTVEATDGTFLSDVLWSTGDETSNIIVTPLATSTTIYEVTVIDPNCNTYITKSIAITPMTPTEWYLDADGDGLGDAYAEPILSCDNLEGNYVDNNDDLCPDQAGTAENSGCPLGLEPENRNTITVWSYDVNGILKGSSRSYFNALGKLEQTQAYDVKSDSIWAGVTLYDAFGRPVLQSLSAPVRKGFEYSYKDDFIKKENNIGDYNLSDYEGDNNEQPNPVGNNVNTLGWYYSENNDREPYQDITAYPFSKSVYSKLNPGATLRTLGGNKINGKWPQAYSFTMRASQELAQSVAFGSTDYNSYKILKTVTRDARGVENVVFTDTDGKVLAAARSGEEGQVSPPLTITIPEQGFLDIHIPEGIIGISTSNTNALEVYDLIKDEKSQTSLSALPNGFYRIAVKNLANYVVNSISISYRVNYYDYSLNEYDETGRLLKSYQPLGATKAVKPFTEYKYNTLGQLIYTKSPDEGEAWFKYREDGQIRYSQNSKQAAVGEFSYTNYDDLGRPVESGVVSSTAFTTVDPDDNSPDSPTGIKEQQQFTAYDNLEPYQLSFLATLLGNYGNPSFLAGNVPYTRNEEAETYYSYDVYGRVKWIVQDINGLGTKTIDYEYDAITGLVTKVIYQKANADQFIHRYSYNEVDQLVLVETSADDANYTERAAYGYYETGALKRTELAGGVQGIDYVYNLAGQLKSMNHPGLNDTDDPGRDSNDLFGMQLDYNSADYMRNKPNITKTPLGQDQLNGNIKSIRWSNANPNTAQSQYVYEYNRNNWLTGADFAPSDSQQDIIPDDDSAAIYTNGQADNLTAAQSFTLKPGFHAQAGSTVRVSIVTNAGIGNGDYDVSNISYDANGNILSLNRNKDFQNNTNAMDKLSYSYKTSPQDGPNQLLRVKDDVVNPTNADDIASQPLNNYVYNAIGQLIYNTEEKIDYFYNASGLVTQVDKDGQPAVKFYYNDRNHRIKKESYNDGVLASTSYYVRDVAGQVMAIYNDYSGSMALAEQPIYGSGRIGVYYTPPLGGTGGAVYELTDHLGNVRATFTKNESTGIAQGEGYTDYYPFGMPMPGRGVFGPEGYRYAFQGQEKDPETGKEAFELRLWDSRIGRWLTTDPYGEFASPYLGMGNNPISLVDPDGGMTDSCCDDDIGQIIRDGLGISSPEHTFGGYNDFEHVFSNVSFALDKVTGFGDALNIGDLREYRLGQNVKGGIFLNYGAGISGTSRTEVWNGSQWIPTEEFDQARTQKFASSFLPVGRGFQAVIQTGRFLRFLKSQRLISSSLRVVKGKTPRGIQALDKKIKRGDDAFRGLKINQQTVGEIINDVMNSSHRIKHFTRNQQGKKVIDYYNTQTGQGVRTLNGKFDTFLSY